MPSASPGDSKPSVVVSYDDKGFTTLVTVYPGTTPAPTVNGLQNNAAESSGPVAPMAAKSAGSKLFDGIYLQLISAVFAFFFQQAW